MDNFEYPSRLFHGGNRGSNLLGDANQINYLLETAATGVPVVSRLRSLHAFDVRPDLVSNAAAPACKLQAHRVFTPVWIGRPSWI